MPRDIRVGDKVRLLPLGGDGLMAVFVGCIGIIEDMDSQRKLAWVADVGVWWPLSKLELIDAPRPSAWIKTSEGKPDVGVWVLGWLPCDGAAKERGFPDQYVCRRSLSNPDAWEVESVTPWRDDDFLPVNTPHYWQPLPAPPEVPR